MGKKRKSIESFSSTLSFLYFKIGEYYSMPNQLYNKKNMMFYTLDKFSFVKYKLRPFIDSMINEREDIHIDLELIIDADKGDYLKCRLDFSCIDNTVSLEPCFIHESQSKSFVVGNRTKPVNAIGIKDMRNHLNKVEDDLEWTNIPQKSIDKLLPVYKDLLYAIRKSFKFGLNKKEQDKNT